MKFIILTITVNNATSSKNINLRKKIIQKNIIHYVKIQLINTQLIIKY